MWCTELLVINIVIFLNLGPLVKVMQEVINCLTIYIQGDLNAGSQHIITVADVYALLHHFAMGKMAQIAKLCNYRHV